MKNVTDLVRDLLHMKVLKILPQMDTLSVCTTEVRHSCHLINYEFLFEEQAFLFVFC